ncbi:MULTISPECIES: type II secretion system F family protein [Pontibacillus]|uniref:Type II secretion system F family protein n=1 Tax=Pontibacillus chungwhensis TaxID=265426 RepID=A0ABY8UU04_9BACI|nr:MULTISPECIES: type II secretion system F family protein [Pontibacillus]MCD5323134.1 type II secretion system F family protein [Pontibacillus sp. HN14]WIF96522.1 type II secretion system F family protein [Pontibacillus chungwhensis]
MIGFGIATLVIIMMYFVLSLKAGKRYNRFVEQFGTDFQLNFMAPVSLYLIDYFQIMERMYGQISFIQKRMISIHGHRQALMYTKMYLAQLISTVLVCLLGSTLVALLANGDLTLFIAGMVFTIMIPFVLVQKLSNEEKERKDQILTELPEVVNKIILLVNAGETVQRALVHCVSSTKDKNSPLYKELRDTVNKLTSNEPFHQVMNDLSKKVGIQEVSIFTTTILLNYRKGGQDLILALRELSQDLWEKRKNISKTKGEEASSKLVFPLILIFIAVMIIVGYPAITIL